jgi:hypothetical protein
VKGRGNEGDGVGIGLVLALALQRDGMSAVSGSGPDRDLWPWEELRTSGLGAQHSGAQEEERKESERARG